MTRHRPRAVLIGLALFLPALWLELDGRGPWWLDGLAVLVASTGVALIWTGLTGARTDWVE